MEDGRADEIRTLPVLYDKQAERFRTWHDVANQPVRDGFIDTDGIALESSKARSLLVIMMLMMREPKAFLWPFPHADITGDVIEAVLGLCIPWREAHSSFRQQFAEAWGLSLGHLTELHGRIEDAQVHVSKLVAVAHHHPIAQEAGCPQTWKAMEEANFKLRAPMLVLEEIVPAASLTSLGACQCSVCAVHEALAGSDTGLGSNDQAASLTYIGGGTALSNTSLAAPAPAAPAPGTVLVPPSIEDDRLDPDQNNGRLLHL